LSAVELSAAAANAGEKLVTRKKARMQGRNILEDCM